MGTKIIFAARRCLFFFGRTEKRPERETTAAKGGGRGACGEMGQGLSRSEVSSGVSDIGERVPRTTPWVNDFEYQFRTALRTLDLENHAKTQIVVRYMVVTKQFIHHSQRITLIYNGMRVLIIIGGLLTPALITVFPQVCESGFDPWIPTLILSLLVSASNSCIEVFGIVKRHQTAMATKGALMNEGWHFASLSGRYGKYTHHRQCWRKFMFYVNQLVAKAENQYILSDSALNTRMPRGANDGDLIPVWNDGSSNASGLRGIPVDNDVMRGNYEIDMATSFSSSAAAATGATIDPSTSEELRGARALEMLHHGGGVGDASAESGSEHSEGGDSGDDMV